LKLYSQYSSKEATGNCPITRQCRGERRKRKKKFISEEDDAAFIPLFHINDLQTRQFWGSRLEHRNDISKEGADPCLLAYQIQAAVDVNTPDFALSP
jgi:hypothetical protein